MPSEQERLELVRRKVAALRLRRRLRVVGITTAVVLLAGVAAVAREQGGERVGVVAGQPPSASEPEAEQPAPASTTSTPPPSSTAPEPDAAQPTTTTTTTAPTQVGEAICVKEVSETSGDNAALTVEVCVSNATPVVGEEVVFHVRAVDPDARLFPLGSCEPNVLWFGDEEGRCAMTPGCVPEQEPAAKEEGKLDQQLVHAYQQPGTYTAEAAVLSGSQCPHPYANELRVALTVEVRGG